ncbi:mitochondrial inner membrane protein OXA1L-like [Agelaius tricolor]|uniref:mitochondrial inner membrane protein OXA1L-like n=1 Tax=Agelaius tricolor TaxID=9191 RepID=UPI0039F1BEA2
MMAAAAPRLRPLLRALRAQRFRGPVWCCGAPAVRGVASDAGQPPAPPPAPEIAQIPGDLPHLGEPRLQELGLGGCSPVGLVQNLLEFLHLELGLPWAGAIAAGTVGVPAAAAAAGAAGPARGRPALPAPPAAAAAEPARG